MMVNELTNAILQLLFFTLIPFLVYVIRYKKRTGFFNYIGLKKSATKANLLALLIVLLVGVPFLTLAHFNEEFRGILTGETTMIGKFRSIGFGTSWLVLLVADAVIKTALSEEILFRGFIAKRLIAVTSFQTGNILQATIFGLVHALLFALITQNILFLFVIFFFPTVAAYFKTYLNEKLANGSIIPGWIAHGVGNMLAYGGGYFLFG